MNKFKHLTEPEWDGLVLMATNLGRRTEGFRNVQMPESLFRKMFDELWEHRQCLTSEDMGALIKQLAPKIINHNKEEK